MDEQPLISVIVPIYNVEKYVGKCLESLKNQTMKQIEVICIDDGSTDESGRIADEYKKGDWPSFKVIHTENRGLSAARNRGIDEAKADWLMFVDSDDWVEPDYCRVPWAAKTEYGADLVIFQNRTMGIRKNSRRKNRISKDRPCGLVSNETAIEYGGAVAWNKLYKYSLFTNIRYPENRVYEDIATTHKLIYEAKSCVLLPDTLYNHLKRKDSLSNIIVEKNKKDGFISALERYNDLNSYEYPLEKHQAFLWSHALTLLAKAKSEDAVVKMAEEICDSIPGIPSQLQIKKKTMLAIWKIDRKMFHAICFLLGQKEK